MARQKANPIMNIATSLTSLKLELTRWVQWLLRIPPGNSGSSLRRLVYPFARCGEGCHISENVQIDHARKISLGSHVSINRGSILNGGGGIEIGNNSLIGPGVIIYSQNHVFSETSIPIRLQGYSYKSVTIGEDCWIGANSIILPGVTLGNNTVVAAGSVVTRSQSGRVLIGGNPAKVIRERS